jgi:Flp pilus assembly protein TadD
MKTTIMPTILIPWFAWTGLAAATAIGAERPSASTLTRIKSFGVSEKLIAKDGIRVDENAWRIDAKGKRTVRLFEMSDPGVEDCKVLFRAKLKSEALDGQAYLEMWCRVPGGNLAFSRGLTDSVTGTTDWASCETPFHLKNGESCDLIKLNVVLEGKGTLWIKDIELVKAPAKPETAAESTSKPAAAAGSRPRSGAGNAAELTQQGWALWQKGDLAEAAVKFEQAVQLAPKSEAAWNGLGWANLNSGKTAEARKAFQRLIAINPRHPAALNGLGQLALMQRKYDQAETYLLKSAGSPGATAAWYGLARLYLLQEKYDKAEKWAQKLVSSGQADDDGKQMLEAAKNKHVSDELRKLIEPPKNESESDAPGASRDR